MEAPGNEQKLQDALHVLEVMSTMEGYNAVMGSSKDKIMCSIRGFTLPETSPYYEAVQKINAGYEMPVVYNGWEEYIVNFGEAIHAMLQGEMTAQEALATLDTTKAAVQAKGETYYANVTELLDSAQTAQLVGQIFMDAIHADAALISYNIYYPDVKAPNENYAGVNGCILPGHLTDADIVIFLPTGWYDNIRFVQITGAQFMQMAKDGCDVHGTGHYYPYVALTKDGQPLQEDATYTVVLCGISKDLRETVVRQDSGVVGLDAAKAYLLKVGEVSTAALDNSLLVNIGE